jgi:hypothetical protein
MAYEQQSWATRPLRVDFSRQSRGPHLQSQLATLQMQRLNANTIIQQYDSFEAKLKPYILVLTGQPLDTSPSRSKHPLPGSFACHF